MMRNKIFRDANPKWMRPMSDQHENGVFGRVSVDFGETLSAHRQGPPVNKIGNSQLGGGRKRRLVALPGI